MLRKAFDHPLTTMLNPKIKRVYIFMYLKIIIYFIRLNLPRILLHTHHCIVIETYILFLNFNIIYLIYISLETKLNAYCMNVLQPQGLWQNLNCYPLYEMKKSLCGKEIQNLILQH